MQIHRYFFIGIVLQNFYIIANSKNQKRKTYIERNFRQKNYCSWKKSSEFHKLFFPSYLKRVQAINLFIDSFIFYFKLQIFDYFMNDMKWNYAETFSQLLRLFECMWHVIGRIKWAIWPLRGQYHITSPILFFLG